MLPTIAFVGGILYGQHKLGKYKSMEKKEVEEKEHARQKKHEDEVQKLKKQISELQDKLNRYERLLFLIDHILDNSDQLLVFI